MDLNDSNLELLTAQQGLIARRQLVPRIGIDATDNMLRSDRFHRLHRGVYELRGSGRSPGRTTMAAALWAGPDAIVSGPAAFYLGFGDGLELDDRGMVLVPQRRRHTPAGVAQLRRGALRASPEEHRRQRAEPVVLCHDPSPPSVKQHRGEVALASPVDALLDCLRLEPPVPGRRLRVAHDRLRWSGQLHPGALQHRARERGLGPAIATHELLTIDGAEATGDGERALGALLRGFRPAPEPQVWVTPSRRVDWYFRPLRVAIEYQGSVDHAHATGRTRDRARDEELVRAGISLIYVDAADLRHERTVLSRVAAALVARAHELAVAAPTYRG
jgi:very-short-patch-repair endonuclease